MERGRANAPAHGPDSEEVLSIPIAPFGTMDIEPEQICDILGLTVNGQRIDSAGVVTGVRGFDWSGRTTYWQSTHLMQSANDARIFIQKMRDAFPGSILVQPEWGSHGQLRCRKIRFLMASDELAALGIDPDETLLQKALSGEKISTEEFESIFAYRIDLRRMDRTGDDVTGARYIHNHGAAELHLHYFTIQHHRYRICTQYPTADATAQARTKTLLSLIEASFCVGLTAVNLQTRDVMTENVRDLNETRSYSIALRDEWLAKPDSYLFVGRTLHNDEFGGAGGIFYGARPCVP